MSWCGPRGTMPTWALAEALWGAKSLFPRFWGR